MSKDCFTQTFDQPRSHLQYLRQLKHLAELHRHVIPCDKIKTVLLHNTDATLVDIIEKRYVNYLQRSNIETQFIYTDNNIVS